MSLIEWKDEFSVGVAAVDAEHRELIGTINDLHSAMQAKRTHDHVVEMLGEIYAQISAHFALEETIMRNANYPELISHKADHEDLLDALINIIDDVEDEGGYDEQQLAGQLDGWFSVHFRTHDAKLHLRLG